MNLAFPFMVPGIILLGVWRVAYGVYQLRVLGVEPKPLDVILRIVIVGGVGLFAIIRGALLIYLVFSFGKAMIKMWFGAIFPKSKLTSMDTMRSAFRFRQGRLAARPKFARWK